MGLGYVGTVAAVGLAAAGHDVLGIDINPQRVEACSDGNIPFFEPRLSEFLNDGLDKGNLRFLTNDRVSEPLGDVVIVATGTPPTSTGAADLAQVKDSLSWIKSVQPQGCIVLMKSTVPPGTGIRLSKTLLGGGHFEYVSNPEFLREGSAIHDWFNPDRIVLGGSKKSVQVVKSLFHNLHAPYVTTDITSAEMIKYSANAFLATKISFINEIAMLCDKLGATIDDVSEGIGLDPRIGSNYLKAGVGYGGSCFPKDVRAFDQLALNVDHNFELLKSVININNRQRKVPFYALKEHFEMLADVEIGVLGLAFKPNTDDIRESPSVDLIRMLVDAGARVRVFDPQANITANNPDLHKVSLGRDLAACARGAQALVLMTDWPEIVEADWKSLANHLLPPRYFFDGRNALNPLEMMNFGYVYRGIGRSRIGIGNAIDKDMGNTS